MIVLGFVYAQSGYNIFTLNKGKIMNMTQRILLGLCILLVDLAVFFLPLTAVFLMYILIANPPWFRDFLNNLDNFGPSSQA